MVLSSWPGGFLDTFCCFYPGGGYRAECVPLLYAHVTSAPRNQNLSYSNEGVSLVTDKTKCLGDS